ncbi:MAG: hypothetical protein V1800_13600 [Candidatus Latescibacterota bacterium]
MAVQLENRHVRYVIGNDGRNHHFVDTRTEREYGAHCPGAAFAWVKKAGQRHDASSVSVADGRIDVAFGTSQIRAVLGAEVHDRYLILEVLSLHGDEVDEFVFVDLLLTLDGVPEESFAACALALNLQTKVAEIPGPNSHLRAACYPRFGFSGARVALVGCPQEELRGVLQEVVSAACDLPHSPLGGPWALDAPINKGSYLFNFGNVTEETVGDWIRLAQNLGFTQLDFHGGTSFRFGDCQPDPQMYPQGTASLKAVVDQLHAAGISAGLHTYAFFMDKKCPWVTPVPDSRLGRDRSFTLTADMTSEATTVPVIETTEAMSALTGFFVRNSVTLQVDDELITYTGITKEFPYAFTGCKRGACGTRIASHAAGAKAHHLKECFGLFTPEADSTLFEEVAARTAQVFNECGFDMIYLDALDGEDILGGPENGWHYGSKFVFDLWKRLNKPALMEMSTFHHHLWFVRSRMGAWDHPVRSHKKFIDLHCATNQDCRRMFLPAHLGWWALKTWSGAQGDPTFSDDIEYLCGKALGTDTGFSLMGVDPESIHEVPAFSALTQIIKEYETLRHQNVLPESVKARLREPGAEFTLIPNADGPPQLRPVRYDRHKVAGTDGWSNAWQTHNPFGRQPIALRIEALMVAGPYDAPENRVLGDFAQISDFPDRDSAEQVRATLCPSSDRVKIGSVSGCYTATHGDRLRASSDTGRSSSPLEHGIIPVAPGSAWTKRAKQFSPPLDLSMQQGLGVWVHGDGKGAVLNLQVKSPEHVSPGIADHYIFGDFVGWRYFELIEPEGKRSADYGWPYADSAYHLYRECVDYSQVESLSLWLGNLPPNQTVTCYLSPIQALPLTTGTLSHPSVALGGRCITFPTEMESGSYVEFRSMSDCTLYGPRGERIRSLLPQGEVPILEPGTNLIEFASAALGGMQARAHVTVISRGAPLSEN